MTLWAQLYKIVVVTVASAYLAAGLLGLRVSKTERDRIDPSVRSSPGGYRSFHFWHSGYAGGK